MTVEQIVKSRWINADDNDITFILFNMTPFPVGKITARILYKATDRFLRAKENGIRLCDFCNNKVENDEMVCPSCDESLKNCVDEP